MALKWDVIDFDGPEPKIKIVRVADGRHVREGTKNEYSRAPVPMCDQLGAKLLYYKDEYPPINGWLFGSIKTGRPLWDDALRENHLRPALLRMAAKFRLNGAPEGTGFHAFRHACSALITDVSATAEELKKVQCNYCAKATGALTTAMEDQLSLSGTKPVSHRSHRTGDWRKDQLANRL